MTGDRTLIPGNATLGHNLGQGGVINRGFIHTSNRTYTVNRCHGDSNHVSASPANDKANGTYNYSGKYRVRTGHDGQGNNAVSGDEGQTSPRETLKAAVLFRFADKLDVVLMALGTAGALGAGMCHPAVKFLYGQTITAFILHDIYRNQGSGNATANSSSESGFSFSEAEVTDISRFIRHGYSWWFVLLGAGSTVGGVVHHYCWTVTGQRQIRRIRDLYFSSLIQQDFLWLDRQNTRKLAAKFATDMDCIARGLGQGMGLFCRFLCVWLVSFVFAFLQSWQLALTCFSTLALYALVASLNTKAMYRMTKREKEEYAVAGAIAEETFAGIRTVAAFNGQEKDYQRYRKQLGQAESLLTKKGLREGLLHATVDAINIATATIVIVFGTELFSRREIEPGEIISVLKDFTFTIQHGQTVAFVGHSGCGKSTVVQLLERFYTPQHGTVSLDGSDVRELDSRWLRRQIGFVGQEPVLFATTIAENIRYGFAEASRDNIVDAAILANAHDFIQDLPKGYDTYVGDAGCQLSGGQKQRIAIARALVRDPSILLLDEATSALDGEGEAIVQRAIEKAQRGRTTVMIAHRLSTVVNADKIIVMKAGKIWEQGTHAELLALDGCYKHLVKQQMWTSPDGKVSKLRDGASKVRHAGPARTETTRSPSTRQQGNEGGKAEEEEEEEKEEEEVVEEPARTMSLVRGILALGRPELCLNVVGLVCAFVYGPTFPLMSLGLSEMLKIFQQSPAVMRERIASLAMIIVPSTLVYFLLRVVGAVMLSRAAAKLTTRVRDRLFFNIVHQDMAFFDERRNRVGLLTNRLSTDAVTIHGASAMKLAFVMECLSTWLTVVIISVLYSWKLALVLLSFLPVELAAAVVSLMNRQGRSNMTAATADTGQVLQEAIANIKLIRSLACEDMFKDSFHRHTAALYRSALSRCWRLSVAFSLSQSCICFLVAACVTYGAHLVQTEHMEAYIVFRIYMLVNSASFIIGLAASNVDDFGHAKMAALRVLSTLDREPRIRLHENNRTMKELQGEVTLDKVEFHYPSRPGARVLKGLTCSVQPGERIGILGASGSGKSTLIALLERFYDVTSGALLVDGEQLRDVDLFWYRAQIGLVPQEPDLFDVTVAENIQYGDNSREVPTCDVIKAARTAGLHDCVTALPQGYDTVVGSKGRQLSGGEKQRVAIARALVRNPQLLLLDEVTAALDSQTEKAVQEALDEASEGRTTVVLAHRLSAVQRCHRILLVQDGQVAESGTHDELIARRGVYFRLIQSEGGTQTSSVIQDTRL